MPLYTAFVPPIKLLTRLISALVKVAGVRLLTLNVAHSEEDVRVDGLDLHRQ